MIRNTIRMLSGVVLLFGVTFGRAQTEFSAEIKDPQKPEASTRVKIYFSKDKVRVEPTRETARRIGAIILNLKTQTIFVLMDQPRMYMEMPPKPNDQKIGYNFFHTGDVDNACNDWLEMGIHHGGKCRRVGNEKVNHRSTVKYEGMDADGYNTTFWLDRKLHFPVKWQGKHSQGELRDIRKRSQPSKLFEVPAGYTKLEVGGITQQPK